MAHLTVVPITYDDQIKVVSYFHGQTDDQLAVMGCDRDCFPAPSLWRKQIFFEAAKPIRKRSLYYVGWYVDGALIGHSSLTDATFGKTALTHLHMWSPSIMGKGYGSELFRLSLLHFFRTFRLTQIFCEPKASNPGPNGVTRRLGIPIAKTYETKPGPMHMSQTVNRYEISASQIMPD